VSALTSGDARAQHAHELQGRRASEAACALDFLVYGDGDGPTMTPWGSSVPVAHAERCIHGPRAACSRTYDPVPYDEAEPVDARLYEGTSIGALYGLPGSEGIVLELEGWELAPRTVYE
jgi:hypothetical protein